MMRPVLLVFIATKFVSSCPSNNNVFTSTGGSATIQYNANSLPVSNILVTYRMKDPGGTPRAQFGTQSGQITSSGVQVLNMTFTGDASTGDLSFRIDNIQTGDTGVYMIVKDIEPNTALLCNTVYITGNLNTPIVTANKSPSIGESVVLTCSSSSTTVPAGLPLVYTWQVDGATNPSDPRYTYSTSRDTLTISGIQRSDTNKRFTCTGKEQESQVTSSTSDQFRIDVHYGPENVRLDPSSTSYTRTENTTLGTITCTADCYPTCTYTWTHLTNTWNNAVLNLGHISRSEAGVYRCTVTRSAGNQGFVDMALKVQFPPHSVTISGNNNIILANGVNKVQLTCTTTTSNPAATISWFKNGSPIDNTRHPTETDGDYGGKITSQILELTLTRDDDGDTYTCKASNTLNSQSPVSSQGKVLDLKYHPIVSSMTGPSSPVTEGQTTNNVFRCTVSSNPPSTVTWYHNNNQVHQSMTPDSENVYSYSILNITRTYSGIYKCKADNNIEPIGQGNFSLSIHFAPLSVNLSGNTNILANSVNKVQLTCTTTTSNPAATISWFKNGSPLDDTITPNVTDGDYGGKITSQILELTPTRDDDGDIYTCQASNTLNSQSPVSSQHILNLLYIPIITTSMMPVDVTECTDRLTLTCTVSSKPDSTITWYKDDKQLPSTGDNNMKVYSINDVNRTATGQYRCKANNGYGGDKQDTVNVTVKYRPDISVTTTNVTTQDSSVEIVCNPSGVPDQYIFSTWTHQWDINGQNLNHPGLGNNPVLKLTNLKYSHSGVYTCTVSNGIECSRNQNAGSGHATLLVKASPVIIDPEPSPNDGRIQVASKINSAAIVNITFWSNAGNVDIRCHRIKDNTWLNSPEVEIVQTQTTLRLPVFSSYVSTTGTLASVSLMIRNKEEFGEYDIVLSNGIDGNRKLEIIIVAQGPPEVPVLEAVQVLSPSSVSVNWTRGFHGGLDQTIVIQISTDKINWQNKTAIPDGKNESLVKVTTYLQGLSPSTLYYMRMLAYNDEGRSDNVTVIFSFTTHAEVTTTSPIGAIAGGVGGVAAVIIIIVIVLFILKQRNIIGGKRPSDTEPIRRSNEESRNGSSADEEMVENNLYISADAVPSQSQDPSPVYSQPMKGKHITTKTGDLYAVVSKPKKAGIDETKLQTPESGKNKGKAPKGKKHDKKKGKVQKSNGDDVYENAPESATTTAAGTDNVYETTELSPPPRAARKVNKDGLLYADIEFRPAVEPNGQPVIHGLDDMTLYSDIDFTKKAEPLPDSDDEKDKKSK